MGTHHFTAFRTELNTCLDVGTKTCYEIFLNITIVQILFDSQLQLNKTRYSWRLSLIPKVLILIVSNNRYFFLLIFFIRVLFNEYCKCNSSRRYKVWKCVLSAQKVYRNRLYCRALKRGVKLGILQMECGRYRLNEMSRLACPEVAAQHERHHDMRRPRERPLRLRSRTPSRHTLAKYDRKRKS